MTVLITGGTGYIGSHTVVELVTQGMDCVIVDNLSKSLAITLERIEDVVHTKIPFEQIDLLDKEVLQQVFYKYDITSVIHFAGFKSVGESVKKPLMYYENNLISTLNLLEVMEEANVKKLVFSSSATVYGDSHTPPLTEELSLSAPNPYGRTKLMLEEILRDIFATDDKWSIALMRYFNPIGAHYSGLLGESPYGIPNNLLPYVLKVASGEIETLQIFGGDYNTKDGTCIRDFIHVMDLAEGHIQALKYIQNHNGCEAFNLGTGSGYSVLELIKEFERINYIDVPYTIGPRRKGDIMTSIADVEKAKALLGWSAERTLEDMCRDSWTWANKAKGYLVK
ncbi:UDP-glucose 4-epimerase GalE [Viridibacillus sp. YIM B01967]|uniref:UDP-glucose 4-epimerase n=1 Tax=Viridibacillus soli TaxID=2798301 RepID=A0ABS1HCR2_9BACL|nr:UDP-glucose 4-epimerase GalE [Viridibacillus soli]MBK3497121.1 UDP-glucose 4-epimerase GalE [Viridibacillus soli]